LSLIVFSAIIPGVATTADHVTGGTLVLAGHWLTLAAALLVAAVVVGLALWSAR
jgi:hypothetical protein